MGEGVNAQALGLAGGLLWGASVLVLGLGAIWVSDWAVFVDWLGQFYLGYEPTIIGSIIGGVWGFLDLFIGLFVFAWLYNYFSDNPLF